MAARGQRVDHPRPLSSDGGLSDTRDGFAIPGVPVPR